MFGFDTAPSYKTEDMLGEVLKTLMAKEVVKRKDLFISDKIDAWQMQEGNGDIRNYVKDAMQIVLNGNKQRRFSVINGKILTNLCVII